MSDEGLASGVVRGRFSDVAPAIAGALAEAGVRVLMWREPEGGTTRLETRATDLPGLIGRARCGTRIEDDLGLIVLELEPNQIRWRAVPPLARVLERIGSGA